MTLELMSIKESLKSRYLSKEASLIFEINKIKAI